MNKYPYLAILIFAMLYCTNAISAVAALQRITVPDNCLIDLHLHLDGSLSIKNARALAKIQNIPIPPDDTKLRALLQAPPNCENLNDYLRCFDFPLTLLQTKEGISQCIYTLKEELKEQGVIYAEIRFAPQLHTQKGLTQEDAIQAAIDGDRRSSLKSGLIVCCMRGANNKAENWLTADLARKYLNKGVCAIDLAGAEALFPTGNFKDLFEYARQQNIPFTIHAGEADGPESVRTALSFGAKRIGHGVRSREDPELLKKLAEAKVSLNMCPTSNLNTRVVARIEDYPIVKYMQAGIVVTVNTDNMAVSNTTVRRELQLIVDTFQLDAAAIKCLLLNSVNASFAAPATRAELREKIEKAFRTQRKMN